MTEFRKLTLIETIQSMGWTNKEVAQILGVSEKTVQRKKSGESDWTITDLKIISEKSNIPISQIDF